MIAAVSYSTIVGPISYSLSIFFLNESETVPLLTCSVMLTKLSAAWRRHQAAPTAPVALPAVEENAMPVADQCGSSGRHAGKMDMQHNIYCTKNNPQICANRTYNLLKKTSQIKNGFNALWNAHESSWRNSPGTKWPPPFWTPKKVTFWSPPRHGISWNYHIYHWNHGGNNNLQQLYNSISIHFGMTTLTTSVPDVPAAESWTLDSSSASSTWRTSRDKFCDAHILKLSAKKWDRSQGFYTPEYLQKPCCTNL